VERSDLRMENQGRLVQSSLLQQGEAHFHLRERDGAVARITCVTPNCKGASKRSFTPRES
jgi:hypothetical protein